jgi:4-amino-4-deoxy-L-arabinose transferase-like glycosyltransferase
LRRSLPAGLVLVVLALAASLTFELRGRVPFTSDQAVVAIMANDILERGVHPVFYYGAEYAGTLEPHYVAVVFALLGASPATFRAAMAFLLVLVVLAVWAGTRAAFGGRAGFIAGVYLAVGPSFFLYKSLCSDGAYVSLLLLSATALWLVVLIEGRFSEAASADWLLLALGLVLGLAWWVHSPSAFLGPVVGVAALAGTTSRWLAPPSVSRILLGFFAGSLPWWSRNLQTGMASLHSPEMAAAPPGRLTAQAIALFTDGWSTLLGARSVWAWNQVTFPGACAVSLILLGIVIAFGVSESRSADRRSRFGAVVFTAAMVSLSALCLTVSRTDFIEPRYLFAAYSGLAPLVGGVVNALWRRHVARSLLIAALVALNLGSEARAPRMKHTDPRNPYFGDFDLKPVASLLEARGVRAIYTSYWAAYKLTFLTRGRLLATPLGKGMHGMARIAWLREAVDDDPAPVFLLNGEDLQSFLVFLRGRGQPPPRESVAGFDLFTGIPKGALRVVRACQCIPAGLGAGAITIAQVEGPSRVHSQTVTTYRVRVRNGSSRTVSNNVHLSYHWRHPDGSVVVWDGERAELVTWPAPGGEGTLEIGVRSNVPPGEYRLAFDLVDERVGWLSDSGGELPEQRVTVEAPPRR